MNKEIEWINKHIDEQRWSKGLVTDKISDGFHTFGELYYHRLMLFAALCKAHSDKAWRSRKHHDGECPFNDDNWFIVGITTIEGDYTYHYHMSDWNLFDGVKELEVGKEWDGHQSKDITRLLSL